MEEITEKLTRFILDVGALGPILCCVLIVIESIIPILPLAVFIVLNYIFFGSVLGFVLSWAFTIAGCCLSYYLFRYKIKKWFDNRFLKKYNVKKFMKAFENLTFSQLVVLISVPFTPAFLVNVVSGLSKINFKKYLAAIMIGKIFLVLFWGYIGTSLIESVKDPIILVKIFLMITTAYVISKIVNKRYKID